LIINRPQGQKNRKKMKNPKDDSLRIGVCLGGGGALGFAHLGALQALNERVIFPAELAGTSIGAVVGAIYAAGYSPAEIMKIVEEEKLYHNLNIFSLNIQPLRVSSGLSTHTKLRNIIRTHVPHNSFDALKIPLTVCVTNFNIGEYEFVSSGGDLDRWVAASASIPGVFETMYLNKQYYSDGGITNNLPAQALVKTCNFIIGVDVATFIPTPKELKSVAGVAFLTIRLSEKVNSAEGKSLCNLLIESRAAEKYNEFDFKHFKEIYQYGYDAAVEALETTSCNFVLSS
jgi:NTE family protein